MGNLAELETNSKRHFGTYKQLIHDIFYLLCVNITFNIMVLIMFKLICNNCPRYKY